MSEEVTPEIREGFKVYTITLDSGEVLKFPVWNIDDMENLTAGFWDDFRTIAKEFQEATTATQRAQLSTDMHWLQVRAALTPAEIRAWKSLKQMKFFEALSIGSELTGMSEKK